jgi:hypothetical protein
VADIITRIPSIVNLKNTDDMVIPEIEKILGTCRLLIVNRKKKYGDFGKNLSISRIH